MAKTIIMGRAKKRAIAADNQEVAFEVELAEVKAAHA